MQKQKGISTLILIIVIIVVAVVAVGGVFAYQYYTTKSEARNPKSETNLNVQNSNVQTAGWKTYTNTQYGFQVNYLPDTNVMIAPSSKTVNCDASTALSSCPKGISPGYPDKTENQTINGVNYCFYLGDD